MECYPVFVRDVLKRVEEGRPPIANLDDMAATIKLVATAYSMAPLSHEVSDFLFPLQSLTPFAVRTSQTP
jgi:hypothetical protein